MKLIFKSNDVSIGYTLVRAEGAKGKIKIPQTHLGKPVTTIGKQAFERNYELREVNIPEGIKVIDACAFKDCHNLINVIIPNSVMSIGKQAFMHCINLISITIPRSVKLIDDWAFRGCYKLVEVYNCSSLDINENSLSQGEIGCYAKNIYTPTNGSSKLSFVDDFIFYTDETKTYLVGYKGNATELTLPTIGKEYELYPRAFFANEKIKNIKIPEGIKNISELAFTGCRNLKNINIPNDVINIGTAAFKGCYNMTHVTIGNNVTSIGSDAFFGCSKLTNVTIPNSVTNIGSSAFADCDSITSITIPNGIKKISAYIFGNCSKLETVKIPDSVTNIGEGAFFGCTKLTNINISNNITYIGSAAFQCCEKLKRKGNFKATDAKMRCRGYQYEMNQTFHYGRKIKLCHSGFHYCENAFDIFNYYGGIIGKDIRIFDVKPAEISKETLCDSKRVCSNITFVKEYKSFAEFLNG